MNNDIIIADLEEKVDSLKTSGAVMVRQDRSILVGAYRWEAAVAHLIADHIRKPRRNQWCTLECFARFLFGTAHASNMDKARQRITPLSQALLRDGHFLIIDYGGPNGAKSAMRILLPDDDIELVQPQIDRMVQMRDSTSERAELALSIIRSRRGLRDSAEDEQCCEADHGR